MSEKLQENAGSVGNGVLTCFGLLDCTDFGVVSLDSILRCFSGYEYLALMYEGRHGRVHWLLRVIPDRYPSSSDTLGGFSIVGYEETLDDAHPIRDR